jgi:putative AlgH/UPF0301 family transcriptional regulator
MMDKLAENNTARQWRAFSGYSGWLRNQLASEISDKRWLVCRLDNRGIFDLDGEAQWLYAVDMCAAQAMAQYI